MTKSQSLRFNHVQAPIFQRFPKIVVVPPVLIHPYFNRISQFSSIFFGGCSIENHVQPKKIWRFPKVSGTPQIIYPSLFFLP